MLLIPNTCRWCHFVFFVCRFCWRGQAYCCRDCRKAGILRNKREAQRRYRQTEKGKRRHREAENRRRHRKKIQETKNMDDTASTVLPAWCRTIILWILFQIQGLPIKPYCQFCGSSGQVVTQFPRRGYG